MPSEVAFIQYMADTVRGAAAAAASAETEQAAAEPASEDQD